MMYSNILRDDIGCQEIELSWLVRFAGSAGGELADIAAFRAPVDC
jgi:hypothetical protein